MNSFLKTLIQPKAPPYTPEEWERSSLNHRAKAVCLAWIEQGFGAPFSVYLFYLIKIGIYIGGWLFFCQWNPNQSWTTLLAFQKAILWSAFFEGLGWGCGSGPLTARYLPPFGGFLHFLKPGTFKRALFPKLPLFGGSTRSGFDVGLYGLWMIINLICLCSSSLSTYVLGFLVGVCFLLGLVDRVIFLALRAEHYLTLIVCFWLGSTPISELTSAHHDLLPSVKALPIWCFAAVGIQCALWFWAGASKLNAHFATVVCVMLSNSPWCPHWLKMKMYINYPHDVRPSLWAHLAGAGGTCLELIIPCLFIAALFLSPLTPSAFEFHLSPTHFIFSDTSLVNFSLFQWGFLLMLFLHLFITSNVPLGVPLEWNVCVVYSAWFLFDHHGYELAVATQSMTSDFSLVTSLLSSPSIQLMSLAVLLITLIVPLFGNLRPHRLSFLLSMRYYAGNWPYSLWLIHKKSGLKKLKRLPRVVPWVEDQLAAFYSPSQIIGVMGRVMGFRMMHLQGRLITPLLSRLERNVLKEPLHHYLYTEGEIVAGIYLGWNFGDGHLHNEALLTHLNQRASFESDDLLCICVEPQGWFDSSLNYRIVDGKGDLIEESCFEISSLKAMQPWDDSFDKPQK